MTVLPKMHLSFRGNAVTEESLFLGYGFFAFALNDKVALNDIVVWMVFWLLLCEGFCLDSSLRSE